MWERIEALAGRLPAERGLPLVLAFGLVALLLWRLREPLASAWARRRLARNIGRLGWAVLPGAQLPDGMGGERRVDFLVLRPEEILLVFVKHYPGAIFAGERLEQWVQLVDGRSYRFPNPLLEADALAATLSHGWPGLRVRALLVFDHQAQFPKGKPERVLLPSELQALGTPRGEPDADLLDAWERLCSGRVPLGG